MPTYNTSPYLATATALILQLPMLGDGRGAQFTQWVDQDSEPLQKKISELVVEATQPSPYLTGPAYVMLSFMSQVAHKLVHESKSLEPGFSQIVDKEFWNLLR